MLYLPSSNFSCCSNCYEDGGCSRYWYSSEGSTSTHDRNAKTSPAHTHTCKQKQTLRNSTSLHKKQQEKLVELIQKIVKAVYAVFLVSINFLHDYVYTPVVEVNKIIVKGTIDFLKHLNQKISEWSVRIFT